MKPTGFSLILLGVISICFFGCVPKRVYNQLQTNYNDSQNKNQQLEQDKLALTKKANRIGKVGVAQKTSSGDEQKANQFRQQNNWYLDTTSSLMYRNDLIYGLGKIYVYELNDKQWVEGARVDLDLFKAKPKITDPGVTLFSYYIDRGFSSKIEVVKAVALSLGTNSYGKLTYEIVGTSDLDLPQDQLESIAKRYANQYSVTSNVYLCTGYHIRKVSLLKYDSMAGDVSVNVPVGNFAGALYSEQKLEESDWDVYRKLINLTVFLPREGNQESTYSMVKSILGEDFTESFAEDFIEEPSLTLSTYIVNNSGENKAGNGRRFTKNELNSLKQAAHSLRGKDDRLVDKTMKIIINHDEKINN